MKVPRALGVLAVFALVATACTQASPTATIGGGGGGTRSDITIEVVTHGQASDPFWSVVKNGVDQAATDLGITVHYNAPQTFDMPAMAQLIDSAVASDPDGLVISLPDADALGDAVTGAVDAGIPVVSINSGVDDYKGLGIITHVGQTEFIAGQGAGERLADAGVTNTICVNQEVGNAALDQRCEGFADGLGGIPSKVVAVDLADPTGAENTINAELDGDPSIDGILTLGPTGAAPALAALEGREGITLATFDLSPEVLDAIDQGTMLFAIDQQQYLQGYLGVLFATQYAQYGLLPGGGEPILTGPGFVTQENAAQVKELSAQGIR
jgi:simple sugar transport system substrate-binding protein